MMSDRPVGIPMEHDADDCSHNKEFLAPKSRYSGSDQQVMCRRCGAQLWAVGDSTLRVLNAARVVDYEYQCTECGDKFDYPSHAKGHGCDS